VDAVRGDVPLPTRTTSSELAAKELPSVVYGVHSCAVGVGVAVGVAVPDGDDVGDDPDDGDGVTDGVGAMGAHATLRYCVFAGAPAEPTIAHVRVAVL
jgi:hypothetical protein